MKTKITFLLVLCILMQIPAIGQTKKIAEANFLKTINDIAAESRDPHSDSYYTVKTTTPFRISKTGILSATLNYFQIDSIKTIKMTVPIAAISGISCNGDYLTLKSSKYKITTYEENNTTQLFENQQKKYDFFFGFTSENDKRFWKMLKELEKLQKYYKKQ